MRKRKKQDALLTVRLTETDLGFIKSAAARQGLSVSEYVRRHVLPFRYRRTWAPNVTTGGANINVGPLKAVG